MNEYTMFFFIVLPVGIITMISMLVIAMYVESQDKPDRGPQITDTFEEMNDEER